MQDDLIERLREVVQNVEAAKRHVHGLPVAAIRSDTHGNKMALWCDNGMAGVGQVCVAVNVGEFPDSQLAAIAGLANTALSAAKYADRSIARIAALEADKARLMGLVKEAGEALGDFCQAAEYWAGCDEGCTIDAAISEIMSSGGAWPSTAYDKARATLAKIKEATDAE